MKKSTILMTAYAVDPYKGSESGTGWNWILQAAKYNRIIAVTRSNNRPAIEAYFRENPLPEQTEIQWAYFDWPAWARGWKRGERGAWLYQYLWHLTVVFFILRRRWQFDLSHHLNFHSDWTPSFLWILGKPLVWGPVGHHDKIPRPFMQAYDWKAYFNDRLHWLAKQMFWLMDPFLWLTRWLADKVIVVNKSAAEVLEVSGTKLEYMAAVGAFAAGPSAEKDDIFRVLSVGRLIPLKGFDVTLRSFAIFFHNLTWPDQQRVRLTIIGQGPEKDRLQTMATQLEIAAAVDWIEEVAHSEMKDYYADADVFFFPSHEGAGMVVVEALAHGLPVVCFDNDGPGTMVDEYCALTVQYRTYHTAVLDFAGRLDRLFTNPALQRHLSNGARKRFERHYEWNAKGKRLRNIYEELIPGLTTWQTIHPRTMEPQANLANEKTL